MKLLMKPHNTRLTSNIVAQLLFKLELGAKNFIRKTLIY